jgi:predicted dehydrogenase
MKKVLLVGYGNIGKKHEAAISSLSGIELMGIVDPLHSIHVSDGVRHYQNIESFIESDAKADMAAICTPNGQHASQAMKLMRQGLDVLIEKPMAIDKVSAERVIATALETHTKVFCVMQLRYSPIVSWLKRIIEKEELGDIFSIEVRCFWNRNKSYYKPDGQPNHWRGTVAQDKGPLYTQFSHFVDLIYYLLGAWKINHAEFNNFNHQEYTEFEDSGRILFNVGETFGSFAYTTSVFEKNYESTITILGSKGTVSIGGQYFNQVRYAHPMTLPAVDDEELKAYNKNSLSGHMAMYENVLDVLESKKPITTNALDGMKVVEMIEEVYARRID